MATTASHYPPAITRLQSDHVEGRVGPGGAVVARDQHHHVPVLMGHGRLGHLLIDRAPVELHCKAERAAVRVSGVGLD